MATSGPDLLLAAYNALAEEEQDEAFQRIHQLRIDTEAGTESDMSRYVRSMQLVAEALGRTPTSDEYREAQPQLAAAGEPVETFSRLYRFFGSWPRAREAVDLSKTVTPRRIEARFRQRNLGKVWRYDDDDLRDALTRATEHYGYPPSTTQFDWWREREFELARATGQPEPHLPSVGPYRKRFGGWEEALRAHGYSETEIRRRLTTKNSIIRKGHDPDAWLPTGLPMAGLRDEELEDAGLTAEQTVRLREAYAALPRRSRYVLTVRLGLLEDALILKKSAEPLGLSLDRIRQLQMVALDTLTDAVGGPEVEGDGNAAKRGRLREALVKTLRGLAVPGVT